VAFARQARSDACEKPFGQEAASATAVGDGDAVGVLEVEDDAVGVLGVEDDREGVADGEAAGVVDIGGATDGPGSCGEQPTSTSALTATSDAVRRTPDADMGRG
jgi:hypothetical protein